MSKEYFDGGHRRECVMGYGHKCGVHSHVIMSSHDIMRPVPVPAPVTVGVALLKGERGEPRGNNHRQPGDCSFDIPVPVCALYELMNRCWRQPKRKTKTIP